MEKLKRIVEWTKLKIRIHFIEKINFYFHEKEIWWSSLGSNIGNEQDGKNTRFERPVLILKKFNKDMLWILPLTSRERKGKYYYQFEYEGEKYSAILSQIRTISSKRLLRKIRSLPNDDFKNIKKKIKKLL